MNSTQINIDLSNLPLVTNSIYYPLYDDDSRYLVLYGGAGSGKSHFVAQKFLYRILLAETKGTIHNILALRKTQPAVRNSVFALFKYYVSQWGLENICTIKETTMEIVFRGGSRIICMGLDDVEKKKSMEAITSIWMEEATEFLASDLIQLNLRLRGNRKTYYQIVLSFNPISSINWIYKRFFDKTKLPLKSTTVLKSTFRDNRFIDEVYMQQLEDLINEDFQYYQIYNLGEWGVLRNLILNNWEIGKNVSTNPYDYDRVSSGLDFGFNHPSALLRIGSKDGIIYIYNELYESGLTNSDLIDKLRLIGFVQGEGINADSAEPQRIEEIKREGFNVEGVRKYPGFVNDGIDFLKRHKIVIHPDCVGTINEIQSWKWKEDRDGNVLDTPVAFRDDAMAALRYAIEPFREPVSQLDYKGVGHTRLGKGKGCF